MASSLVLCHQVDDKERCYIAAAKLHRPILPARVSGTMETLPVSGN